MSEAGAAVVAFTSPSVVPKLVQQQVDAKEQVASHREEQAFTVIADEVHDDGGATEGREVMMAGREEEGGADTFLFQSYHAGTLVRVSFKFLERKTHF